MRVLVTGAGGFIGSHLCERLVLAGHEVRAFVHYNSSAQSGWLDCSEQKCDMEIVRGDIRDMDAVSTAIKGEDVVFHLASLIGIPYSYYSPLAYLRTNIEGTYNILQAARSLEITRIVHTSTSEIYGTAQYVPIDEAHPVNPQSPYAATKSAADQMALAFYRSFGTPVSVIRPFNTYGPRQSERAVIPTIIGQIISGKTTIRLGNLRATRDFNYVDDTVRGFMQVGLDERAVGRVTNLGTGKEITIGGLVEKIAELMNVHVEVVGDDERMRPKDSEVERLCSDATAAASIGWQPEVSLSRGLRNTIEWLEANGQYLSGGRYVI